MIGLLKERVYFTRISIVFIFLSLILVGCGPPVKPVPTSIAAKEFLFVTAGDTDSLATLAHTHLGRPSNSWKIREFNGVYRTTPGEELIIPLKPFRRGGLTALGYQLVPVLSYHSFSSGRSRARLTVSATKFEAQMSYLNDHGFHVINIEKFLEFLDFGQLPRNSVVITIDGGWPSSYKIAYPILKKFHFPATLFVPTDDINRRKKGVLSWAQAREMFEDGEIDIQFHTMPRRHLTTKKRKESFESYIYSIKSAMTSAKDAIRQNLGVEVQALAYPSGDTNSLVTELAKKTGYRSGFTAKRDGNPFYINNFSLNRAVINGNLSLRKFGDGLAVFRSEKIDDIEPADSAKSVKDIDFARPSQYEEKQQWRTALLSWKLRRDQLVGRFNRLPARVESQQPSAEKRKLLELIEQADRKVFEVTRRLNRMADGFFQSALLKANNDETRTLLLRVLLYNPQHKVAFNSLKNELVGREGLLEYQVKKNDTLRGIALKIYGEEAKAVLIPAFNDGMISDNDLKPGSTLVLPIVPGVIPPPDPPKRCGILTDSPERMAESFYSRGVDEFNRDHIKRARSMLKTAVCLNPGHDKARELKKMLDEL